MTGYARRIQWLQPDPMREVYKTARSGEAGECVRCGGFCRPGEVCFSVRDRGTKWLNLDGGVIHRRCIPTREFTTNGLSARKVRR
jgi:hypothetical protein